jgi:hypothetical protein
MIIVKKVKIPKEENKNKLSCGNYALYRTTEKTAEARAGTININQLIRINRKKGYNTYKALLKQNGNNSRVVYIKACNDLSYAKGIGSQYETFVDTVKDDPELTAPKVIGFIKSPPSIVIEQIRGETLDRVIKISSINQLKQIGTKVGTFLAKYHQKYILPNQKNRIHEEIRHFSIKNRLNIKKIDKLLSEAKLLPSVAHQDPKLSNFIWSSKTLGVLDPTHQPYARLPHYDMAVVLYFPLYSKSLQLSKNHNIYRRQVVKSYSSLRGFEWNRNDYALSGLSLLQIYEPYLKNRMFFGTAKGLFYRLIIALRRYHITKKYNLK